jgi:hypothetical protein
MASFCKYMHFDGYSSGFKKAEVNDRIFDRLRVIFRLNDERGRRLPRNWEVWIRLELVVLKAQVSGIDERLEIRSNLNIVYCVNTIVEAVLVVGA